MHSYYRSHEDVFDPEPAFRTALEAAIACRVLAEAHDAPALRAAAAALDQILARHMKLMTRDYLDFGLADELERPEPDAGDRAQVAAIAERLTQLAPARVPAGRGAGVLTPEDCPAAVMLAHQGRRFLDALDGETHWRRDHARSGTAAGLR